MATTLPPTNGTHPATTPAPGGETLTPQQWIARAREARGLSLIGMAAKVGVEVKFLRRLEEGGQVALNHPFLPHVAAGYGVPPEALTPLLADEPLDPITMRRLETMLARGVRTRRPAGASRAPRDDPGEAEDGKGGEVPAAVHRFKPRRKGGRVPSGVGGLRFRRGLTVHAMAEAAGVPMGAVQAFEAGRLAANYPEPVLRRIAESYGTTLDVVRAALGPRVLPINALHAIERTQGLPLTPAPDGRPTRAPSRARVGGRGKGLVVRNGPVPTAPSGSSSRPGVYNKLKKLPPDTRQMVRGLATQCNLLAMAGQRYITVNDQPIPVAQMMAFLADYLTGKGITTTMLVAPDFADHFDHK